MAVILRHIPQPVLDIGTGFQTEKHTMGVQKRFLRQNLRVLPVTDLRQNHGLTITNERLLILGAGTLAIRAASPMDARAPADERDRAIAGRSAAIAYYVMMTGMVLVGMVMPFTARGWAIVNAALLAIVIAELARCGTIIASYRRGWHG